MRNRPVLAAVFLAWLGSTALDRAEAEPPPVTQEACRSEPARSEALGGGGGGPFERRDPSGAPLVGVRYTTIVWAGHRIVRSLQPLYLGDGRVRSGETVGRPEGAVGEVLARPGYVVAGARVRAGDRVDGLALVFMRLGTSRLDPSTAYEGPWIGGDGGAPPRVIGSTGAIVEGIFGRHGADVDALGLLLRTASPPKDEPGFVRLEFSGRIDGSERIVIGPDEARWENVHWGTSNSTVTLGNVAWTPRRQPVLANRGATRYLPDGVDFATARLVSSKGRDAVALEAGSDAVTLRIADNPNGTGLYELEILFQTVRREVEVSIRATIDGSDEIVLTKEKATWRHRHWGWPTGEVFLADTAWDPRQAPEIPNEGASRFLPEGVDLASARVVRRRGRDLAALDVHEDRLVVRFVDTPIGADVYEIVIRLDARPPLPDPLPVGEDRGVD